MTGIILIGCGLLMYFIGLPLLFYTKYRIQARPTFEVYDPTAGMPEHVRDYFDRCFSEFTQLQFQHLGTFTMPHATLNFKTLFALYEREEGKTTATTTAVFLKVGNEWKFRGQFLALGTHFADGADVTTTNQPDLIVFPTPRGSLRTQHPELESAADLYSAHKSIVAQNGNGRSPVLERITRFGGDPLKYFAEGSFEILASAADAGMLRLKHAQAKSSAAEVEADANPYRAPARNTLDQGSVFVATLRGAFLIMWQNLFPMKQICSRIRFSRDRKTLASTGFRWQKPEFGDSL